MGRRTSTLKPGNTVVVRERRRGQGRPTTLTPRVEETLLGYILDGVSTTTACHLAGVDLSTFYRWMRRGEQTSATINTDRPDGSDEPIEISEYDERYCRFYQAVLDARGQVEHRMIREVIKAVQGGQIISEKPLLDLEGHPVRGDDGEILYERTWSQPDGRLALSYLQRARPADWATAPKQVEHRIERVGPDGATPIAGSGQSGTITHVEQQIDALATRLARVREEAEQEDRRHGDDVVDGEVLEG